jgi:competence protein ComEC
MIAVYNIENMTAIGFIDGNSICFIGDVNTTNNRQRLLYYISSHLTRLHIDEWAFIMKDEPDNPIPSQLQPGPGLVTRDQFIYFYGKKICLIDAEWPDKHPGKLPYDLNFIILRNNPGDPYIDFFKSFEVEHIIFDSTVSSYREKIISQKCQAEGIKLYSVKTEGAWIEKL